MALPKVEDDFALVKKTLADPTDTRCLAVSPVPGLNETELGTCRHAAVASLQVIGSPPSLHVVCSTNGLSSLRVNLTGVDMAGRERAATASVKAPAIN